MCYLLNQIGEGATNKKIQLYVSIFTSVVTFTGVISSCGLELLSSVLSIEPKSFCYVSSMVGMLMINYHSLFTCEYLHFSFIFKHIYNGVLKSFLCGIWYLVISTGSFSLPVLFPWCVGYIFLFLKCLKIFCWKLDILDHIL